MSHFFCSFLAFFFLSLSLSSFSLSSFSLSSFSSLTALGAAYGTAKSGTGIAAMSVLRPELIMKSIIPVVMAGIIAIYGLVVAVLISNGMGGADSYSLFRFVSSTCPPFLSIFVDRFPCSSRTRCLRFPLLGITYTDKFCIDRIHCIITIH